jgi:DNA-binding transcriptional ArsR family regulator
MKYIKIYRSIFAIMDIVQLEHVATLIGDPSRVKILWSLLDGKAYTATELSVFADISRPNASMHLGKLVDADILQVSRQGRHRYYSYARLEVARAVEAMGTLVRPPAAISTGGLKNDPIRYCRTCYDHIAGSVGVAITDKFVECGYICLIGDQFDLTLYGKQFFSDFGIDMEALYGKKRLLTRTCLDWSERRYHLAGSLASAFLNKLIVDNYLRRTDNSRALVVTSKGKKELFELLKIDL